MQHDFMNLKVIQQREYWQRVTNKKVEGIHTTEYLINSEFLPLYHHHTNVYAMVDNSAEHANDGGFVIVG